MFSLRVLRELEGRNPLPEFPDRVFSTSCKFSYAFILGGDKAFKKAKASKTRDAKFKHYREARNEYLKSYQRYPNQYAKTQFELAKAKTEQYRPLHDTASKKDSVTAPLLSKKLR